jgi:hypothetical protein
MDPIVIDPMIMQFIDRYLDLDIDDLSCMVAKFLALFLVDAKFLEMHEIDNFIIRNVDVLSSRSASSWVPRLLLT